MKKIKIFCTIGPKSLNPRTLYRLEKLGVDLFRINLSHTPVSEIEPTIVFIQKYSQTPVCLDTEGAQIRTGGAVGQERFLKLNEEVRVVAASVATFADGISLQPGLVIDQLAEGDLLSLDFNSVLVQVISLHKGRDNSRVLAKVLSAGVIGANKAVTLHRRIKLDAITPKDKEAVKIGKKHGIKNYALSFANSAEDVALFRKITGKGTNVIAKIESRQGHAQLRQILGAADAILIDRGDLSREISLSLIPFYQRHIISEANRAGKEVYVATNLLESMRDKITPTRAEVNDVVNTLMMGADGLVLAAETAIGNWPIESTTMIRRLIDQYQLALSKDIIQQEDNVISSLINPHGGVLVNRLNEHADMEALKKLPALHVPETVDMDVEQICLGTYSPIDGFMGKGDLYGVLDHNRLTDKIVWTMPVILQKWAKEIAHIRRGNTVALQRGPRREIFATMDIAEKFKIDLDEVCLKWFGTNDAAHPGVERTKHLGDHCLAGRLTLVKRRKSPFSLYEFSPSEYRRIFEARGWSKVVGFHTRNVPHRGHEMIQKKALDAIHCDGLLISPVTGQKKRGDFLTEVIFSSYAKLIEQGYLPPEKVFLGSFPTYSRYAGPREAVFTALCRKNYGCSHFIMGRDHTGVGQYYGPVAAQEFMQSLDSIGIEPIFFDEVFYCHDCHDHVFFCGHNSGSTRRISGTQLRQMIEDDEPVPEWMLRPEVSAVIVQQKKITKGVFV